MSAEAFWSGVAGSGVVAAILAFWMNSYFGRYLRRKAENLATHEDIQKLVDQVRETERVKAEIADRMWDRQKRWEFKRDTYMKSIECLAKLVTLRYEISSIETHSANETGPEKVASLRELGELHGHVLQSYKDLMSTANWAIHRGQRKSTRHSCRCDSRRWSPHGLLPRLLWIGPTAGWLQTTSSAVGAAVGAV